MALDVSYIKGCACDSNVSTGVKDMVHVIIADCWWRFVLSDGPPYMFSCSMQFSGEMLARVCPTLWPPPDMFSCASKLSQVWHTWSFELDRETSCAACSISSIL